MPRSPRLALLLLAAAVGLTTACNQKKSLATSATGGCDASIKLPQGFCATVFSESAGPARHLVVRKNGDVIAGVLDQRRQTGGVLVLRDTNHDGHADLEERFGDAGVHGVVLGSDSSLYVSTATAILRYRLTDSLTPKKKVDTIVAGLPARAVPSHTLAIDMRGNLVVNIGALSNGCQAKEAPRAPGRDPCPELETTGGIWTFRTDKTNQQLKDGTRIATGLHNAVALAVNPRDTMVYAVSHDRDGLHDLWPELYSNDESATLPAEEMIRVASTRPDYGWPYCYYDYLKGERVVAPEYGGDKVQTGRCDRLIQPLIAFPAHWSPMSLLFYTGKMFPAQYQTGAFIAFHGSAFRAPLPQEGYQVVFLTFKDGLAADYTVFASGFAGGMSSPEGAAHRPVGLAQGPDGALYLSDDKGGRIWRISYK
ncbi:MAG: L-sorbosone dehydrogenase [Gemmatimonadetes bacterium]|nr:L-sorbosone dehydrogenase [Gemmatimonadota bacterium]